MSDLQENALSSNWHPSKKDRDGIMETDAFVKVRCGKCKNEQVIFGKAASAVKCHVCEEVLAKSTGGKANITARVLETLS